jgi:signal transduction histidine kinase
MLFFLVPVPIWGFVAFMVAKDTFSLLGRADNGIGAAAHVGGAAFGFLYYKAHWRLTTWWPDWRAWRRRQSQPRLRLYREDEEPVTPVTAGVAAGPGEDEQRIRAQTDAILEKISRHGKESLTESERELLLRASTSDGRRLGETYERRLVRTAFDLHDGPLQDLAALAAELGLLRTQVSEAEAVPRDVLVGRIDDVSSRLIELDGSLRAIAQSLEGSALSSRPLPETLRYEVDAFRRRSGIAAELRLSGAFDTLTMSQQIAVARIVQEALANVRAHSGATHVDVCVRATEEALELRVADNGRGFDLRATAKAAARRGRLGIVGMNERIRLLGGHFAIESVPGSGTTVSAAIPAWRPLVG